jgi:hypothetical protein
MLPTSPALSNVCSSVPALLASELVTRPDVDSRRDAGTLGLACDTAGTPSRSRLTPTALSALEEDPALFAEHVHPLASC